MNNILKKLSFFLTPDFKKLLSQNRWKIYTLGGWGLFFLLLWPKMLFYGPDGVYSGYFGVWSDWAAHMTYVSRFLYNDISYWFANHPLMLGIKFTYPFIPDLISAFLIKIGFDKVSSFILPSMITTGFFLWTMYLLYKNYLKSDKKVFAAFWLYFLAGGVGFITFINDLILNYSGIHTKIVEYTRMNSQHIYWVSVIPGELMAQRSLLTGLPIIMFVSLTLLNWANSNFKDIKIYKVVLLALLSALLSIVSAQLFIVLFIVSATILLMRLKSIKHLVIYGFCTTVFFIPIYLIIFQGGVSSEFMRFYPWWIAGADHINWLWFWIINWGILLPLAAFSIWKYKMYKDPIILSAIIIFLLSNFFLFQPWDWDNTKVLNWSLLIFCIPVIEFLGELWHKKDNVWKFVVIVAMGTMTLAGYVDTIRLFDTNRQEALAWTYDDIKFADEFRQISNSKDIILTSDYHHNPITNLSGRQVMMGYEGWISSYGFDYQGLKSDLYVMFAGGEEAEQLFDKYGVTYVLIGPTELNSYDANENYFASKYPLILENGNNRIYKVR